MRYGHLVKRGGKQKQRGFFHGGFGDPWDLSTSGVLQL